MTDKELIKQEIEKRIEQCYRCLAQDLLEIERKETNCCLQQYKELLQFINSLPEESAIEDLENQYKSNMRYQHAYTQDDLMKTKSEDLEEAASKYVREDFHERSRADFKAGAEWQKQQMMKDAVEGEYWIGEIHLDTPIIQGYNDGDRIKFIIIKMNNE